MINFLREIQLFFRELYNNRQLIIHLANRDFRIKYARNRLGLLWAVLEPMALLIIMLLVFTYLRSRAHADYPFVVYLMSGLAGYNFFSSGMSQGANSLKSFSFMLELVHLRTAIIPVISILTSFRTHLIILGITLIILLGNGIGFSIYWFQLLYFIFALWVLLIGTNWITSVLMVFVPDLQHIISIFMRALFFLTPVFWDISIFPAKYRIFLKINPLFHIVEGYRMSLLYHEPFWSDKYAFMFFWINTLGTLLLGFYIFTKLSPYVADINN